MFLLKWSEKILTAFVALLMFMLVVMVFFNVVLRYAFHSGIPATEELSRIVMGVLIMAGTVLALAQNSHISMTTLVERWSPPVLKCLMIAVGGVMLWCDWLLAEGAWMQAKLNFSSSYPLTGLPSSTVYLTAVMAGVLLFIITAVRMVMVLIGRMPVAQFFRADPSYAE